jgi:hypothetical protein
MALPEAGSKPEARRRRPTLAGLGHPHLPLGEDPRPHQLDGAPASVLLQEASNRQQIAQILLAEAARFCGRCAIFTVKRDVLGGWTGRGDGIDPAALRLATLSFRQPSTFRNVVSAGRAYLGPLDRAGGAFVRRALGAEDGDAWMLPIVVDQRVMAVVFGDRLFGEPPSEATVASILAEASNAYGRIAGTVG